MSNRELLTEMGYEDSIVFENPDYDSAIVGVTMDGSVVYDFDLMVDDLMIEGMASWEAADFISYNTIRALPYMPEPRPIIMVRLEDR